MKLHLAIKRLMRICRRWGGSIKLISPKMFGGLFGSYPFWHRVDQRALGFWEAPADPDYGLHVQSLTIYTCAKRPCPGRIIHEMGHLFACDGEIDDAEEFSWLGWEIAMARYVDCYYAWTKQNRNYETGNGEWRYISRRTREKLIVDRLIEAEATGLIDRRGRPQSVGGRKATAPAPC